MLWVMNGRRTFYPQAHERDMRRRKQHPTLDALPSRASAADMTVEQLADWYVELNDPNTIFSVTPRWADEDID